MKYMSTFNLGSKVMVSDPCYEVGTWCQKTLDGVLPGEYDSHVIIDNFGSWGKRVSQLIAHHKNHRLIDLKWEDVDATIGVDSGQAGIFNFETYRKDDIDIHNVPKAFGDDWDKEDGEVWYNRICSLTLNEDGWGAYQNGVVSSSGFGDGSYTLQVAKVDETIVGFKIIFIDEEDEDDEYDDDHDWID